MPIPDYLPMATKSNHSLAFVPIESWAYSSPDLISTGRSLDIGLLAEALIYYDQVIVNVGTQGQFAQLLEWFVRQGRLHELLTLFTDSTLQVYEYSFITAAVHDTAADRYLFWNIQDQAQREPGSFEKRYLYHSQVQELIPKGRHRNQLYQALRGRVIEAKADDYSSVIEAATADFADPRRQAIVLQAFVDELYRYRNIAHPPKIEATVQEIDGGAAHTVTVNIDFAAISELAGPLMNWNKGTPITAVAIANRTLLSASRLNCDLYLPRPMSLLIGDKLYESVRAINKTTETIEDLKTAVDFPDVRALVNAGRLGVDDVLHLRKHAKKFRTWIQTEADRSRDAIIAYHQEVSKEARVTELGRKALNLFGMVGGGALGGALGASMAGPTGAAIGGAAGGTLTYIADLASKLNAGWKPVVFGDWYRERIAELDDGKD